ncbi:MAG: hypothetical protein FJ399_24525 [Verrucomicrobia bacterium]|nr:hypothetical protein [Verrucomicrobiota bacterium]
MPASQTAPFTATEYREMLEDGRRYQIVEGELFLAPAPNTFHQFVQKNLLRILENHLLQHPLGVRC